MRKMLILAAFVVVLGFTTACGGDKNATPTNNGVAAAPAGSARAEVTINCNDSKSVQATAIAAPAGFFGSAGNASVVVTTAPCTERKPRPAKKPCPEDCPPKAASTPAAPAKPTTPKAPSAPKPVATATSGSSLNIQATGEAATVLAKKLTGEQPCCSPAPAEPRPGPRLPAIPPVPEHPVPNYAPADLDKKVQPVEAPVGTVAPAAKPCKAGRTPCTKRGR